MKSPVRVTVTGAAGQISYGLLFRIAAGNMLGPDQPVILQLLEITPAMNALQGVVMELEDCAFPLLESIVATDDPNVGFGDSDYALLVGAMPRKKGMLRKDLLTANSKIFSSQGKAINQSAKSDVRVLVVGNPANTNALITMANAPNVKYGNITAMTRLDHNRAISQLATETKTPSNQIKKMTIWGNHSATQYPDISNTTVGGKSAPELVQESWLRTWALGSEEGDWVSMAIPSDGSYGIPEGLIYSFPVTCSGGQYEIVQGLEISDFSRERMDATATELSEERDEVSELL